MPTPRARPPGVNAGGGERTYSAVYVPWGTAAGKWIIGGASFGETTATALGIPYVVGTAQGISRARYYPGVKPVKVKLLAEPGSLRLIGAQMVGGEGIKERADFLAMAVKFGFTLHDLARMENVYSPGDRCPERADRAWPPRTGSTACGRADMSFFRWLRSNSEHYLLIAAQRADRPAVRRFAARDSRTACGALLAARLRARSTGCCPGRCVTRSCWRCREVIVGSGRRRRKRVGSALQSPCSAEHPTPTREGVWQWHRSSVRGSRRATRSSTTTTRSSRTSRPSPARARTS